MQHLKTTLILAVILLASACSPRSPAAPTQGDLATGTSADPARTPTSISAPGAKTPVTISNDTPKPEVTGTPHLVPGTASPATGTLHPAPGTGTLEPGTWYLALPVSPPGRDVIDPTYRFATTAGGEREPHHGVEFLNSQGTPVVAAADGTVLFAGDDYNGGPYSPKNWFAFYGNFVVLEHDLPGYDQPVYTLYAHLFEIDVETGQTVRQGDQVGLIGFTGAAIGSHLHFEVRYGGTTYADSHNPELWLQPHEGNGTLAGSIRDANGGPIPVFPLQLTFAADPGYAQYFSTYEENALAYLPPFFENFAIGDLPAGTYELSFVAYTLETHTIEIRPGELTFLELTIGAGE